ncbi:hypothetical protein Tco_0898811 [Tanacetum coccineum]
MGSCTVETTPRSPMKIFIQIASFEASQAAIYSDLHVESATVSCFKLSMLLLSYSEFTVVDMVRDRCPVEKNKLAKGIHFLNLFNDPRIIWEQMISTIWVRERRDVVFEPFVSSVVVNVAAVVVIGVAVVVIVAVIVAVVVVESFVGLAKGRPALIPPDVGQRKVDSFTANANEQVNGKCQET